MSGVDLSDFSLVTTGNATGSLGSLVQVDGRTYQITITGVAGSGRLALALNGSGTGVSDMAGNGLVAGLVGQSYSLAQSDGDPEFRSNPPVVPPPEPNVPTESTLPSPPPPPFTSPLLPPPLFEVPTLVFTPTEVRELTERGLELRDTSGPGARHYVTLFHSAPDPAAIAALMAIDAEGERVVVEGRAAYTLIDGDIHSSALLNTKEYGALGQGTARTITVLRAITEKWC